MTARRRWWIACVVVIAALLLAGFALWAWRTTSAPGDHATTTAPTSAPTPPSTDEVRDLAQRALDEHLESCTSEESGPDTVPPRCGIRIPWGTEFASVESIRFRIEEFPVLVLEDADAGFSADGGVLVATVTGTGQNGAPRVETYRTTSWSLRGDLSVDEGDVTIDVW